MGTDREELVILDFEAGTQEECQNEAHGIFYRYRTSLREIVDEAE